MNVLIACEESQTVCLAFRKMGHNAFSCDIQDCSGGYPKWHIKGDVTKLLNGGNFMTMDLKRHIIKKWDLIIAHPPCTHLCVSGARHFEEKRKNGQQEEAIKFFIKFLDCTCEKVCIENPVGIISGNYIKKYFPKICAKNGLPLKPAQIIQPYMFGDNHRKTTCLWLKGLKPLKPTKIVEPTLITYTCKNGKKVTFDEFMIKGFKGDRSKHRSKTFPGIAKAMAEQWG